MMTAPPKQTTLYQGIKIPYQQQQYTQRNIANYNPHIENYDSTT